MIPLIRWNHSIILTCPLLLTETGRSKKTGETRLLPEKKEKENQRRLRVVNTDEHVLLNSKLASNSKGTLHGSCVINNKKNNINKRIKIGVVSRGERSRG